MNEKLDIKEVEKIAKEDAKIDIKNLREDLSILFEQEDKKMKNPRKLPYSEHWMEHWRKKIEKQYLFFYNLGLNSSPPTKTLAKANPTESLICVKEENQK